MPAKRVSSLSSECRGSYPITPLTVGGTAQSVWLPGYRLNDPGKGAGYWHGPGRFHFSIRSRPAMGPTQLPIEWDIWTPFLGA
jgi:hypothetical protein